MCFADRFFGMKNLKLLLLIPFILLVTACGSKDDDAEKPPEAAEKLYNSARDKLAKQNYKEAVKDFEEVERQHPSSVWAANAQIMSAYSSYEAEDYDAAIGTLDRFVKLYPNNDSTPYAYYLTAICYYEQISDVGRDQKITEQALAALREIVRRFPDSDYSRDAKIKLDLTLDHLAGKEMQVGRYYLKRDDTLAAINRFRIVVENYQTTSHVPEALHRLVEAYLKLGITQEATKYAAVLGENYPSSLWYRDSYKLMTGIPAKPTTTPPTEQKTDEKPAEKSAEKPEEKSSFWDHFVPW